MKKKINNLNILNISIKMFKSGQKRDKISVSFNKNLIAFCKSLHEKFHEEDYLRKGYLAVEALDMVYPKKIIELFMTYFYPFKEFALSRNIDKFKDESLKKGLLNLFGKLSDDEDWTVGEEIDRLWVHFDQDEQEHVWTFLKLFINLCDMYNKA